MVAFQRDGHEVLGFSINGQNPWQRLRLNWLERMDVKRVPEVLARYFDAELRRWEPQLVVFVNVFWLPEELLYVARSIPSAPHLIGWVGDRFGAEQRDKAVLLDHIYFTDSGFAAEASGWDFGGNYSYLPLAADEMFYHPGSVRRRAGMVFIGNMTGHREAVVRSLTQPIWIYGGSWKRMQQPTIHHVHSRRISVAQVAQHYAGFRASLNIMNELNVINGVNQRTFEPMASKALVLHDYVEDLGRCFDLGKEVLAYKDEDELNFLHERILGDLPFVEAVAEAGYRRVLGEHTYLHRVRQMLSDLGEKSRAGAV